MNGNPQSYLSQGDSMSPTNSSSMHLGSQSIHMDQYQPQGGNNFHPQGLGVNSYNPNLQYGSYSPQVPASNHVMFENSLDVDDTHRMANSRLKTLIHNRQNQREHSQLMPISNSMHDSAAYGSPVPLSPIGRHPTYTSPYMPASNHTDGHAMHGMSQDMIHNSMPYPGSNSDATTSSLMHLQQLSPNSISPQKVTQPPSWPETPPRKSAKTPELLQKSPVVLTQNGHSDTEPKPTEEPKIVNGHDKPDHANNNGTLLEISNDSTDAPINGLAKGHVENDPKSLEHRKTPAPDIKIPSPHDKVLQPLRVPTVPSRYGLASNPGFMSPSYAYRHLSPHQALVPNPPGCMPPPPPIPPMAVSVPPPQPSTNGGTSHHPTSETNCDEPTQSSPFLLNTTTSMNTYTSITNTYSNSKLSFSNATCLPTFALTSVSNSSQAYVSSYHQQQVHLSSRHQMLPQGGGTSKSCIDSGRIQQDAFASNFPRQSYRCQDLPLPPPNCHPTPYHIQQQGYGNYVSPVAHFPDSNCSTPVGPLADSQDVDPMERLEKLRTNTKLDPPQCDCLKNKEVMPSEKLPYYTHLGSGSSVSAIRELMECRSGEKGKAIRIEKLLYSGKEGKTSQGCPLAKWVIRRSGPEEKLLTVIRHRPGHTCPNAYIIIAMVAWEGVQESVADVLYRTVTYKTVNFGIPTQRKCGTNELRTCACQGLDQETCGASFSFGCSWSMYYNGCKFARSKNARKFKLTEKDEEKELEDRLQMLASDVSHLYKKMAPESFYNQTEFEQQASECRLGVHKGRPFSGVTACLDYCAHSHKDLQNMNNGCTVVVTLTKHRGWEKPEDEQLHVLPLYVMDDTDEFGSKEGQEKKVSSGSVEILTKFPIDYRIRTTPLKPCKTRGRKPKDGFSPRKQALQAAFKQLIASGKLRRIDPPELYRNSRMLSLPNHVQPDSRNPQAAPPCISFSREGTACKFFAGKQVMHSSYADNKTHCDAQGWAPQNFYSPHNPINTSSDENHAQSSFPSVPFVSAPYNSGMPESNSKCSQNEPALQKLAPPLTNTCSKITSGTYVTSSCNAPTHNDRNNNYAPSASYPNAGTTYSHYNPGTNPLPPTFRSQSSVQAPYNYAPYPNNAFHGQYAYGYPHPNVPLKIPGNYSASSYPPQHLGGGNCQNTLYADSRTPLNGSFCNYQKPLAPPSFPAPEHPNSYSNFYHQPNAANASSPRFPISQSTGSEHVKSEISANCGSVYPEKETRSPAENPDSMYTMRDLDSKSVNCFSTSKQSDPSLNSVKKENLNVVQCKKEAADLRYYENPNNNNTSPQYQVDHHQHAKNYNYHLQQSNMILDFDNFNDIVCNNYNAGYEESPFYEKRVGVSNNKDLVSMTKMTESPYPSSHPDAYLHETNHLYALSSKYSSAHLDEEENFIDSTTLEGDEVYEGHSDNESSFKDVEVGGVAIALTHGSVLFECAKHELHATTAVKKPNRRNPTRISLVFYQHKHLNFESHGEAEWGQKMKEKRVGKNANVPYENMKNKNSEMGFDVSANKKLRLVDEDVDNGASGFAGTAPTTSWVTVFSIAPLTVGAPYRP